MVEVGPTPYYYDYGSAPYDTNDGYCYQSNWGPYCCEWVVQSQYDECIETWCYDEYWEEWNYYGAEQCFTIYY